MQPCPPDRPENRNSTLDREWVSRALVHTLRRRACGYAPVCIGVLLVLIVPLSGCTHLTEYVHNGFKLGPNYGRPPAPAAENWIDAADPRVRTQSDDLSRWWTVFNDPVLDALVCHAYLQNLTLRQAGCRVLQARAQQAIAVGNFFPLTQQATGDYRRYARSTKIPNNQNVRAPFYSQWTYGFNLAWELDFWGRFRRAMESANDSLDASVEDYDSVLVTLLGDVATYYLQLRTYEQRLAYVRVTVGLLRDTLRIAEARFKAGTTGELDVVQARSTLEQTEAQIPELEIGLRQANNQLCVLLGIPPEELRARLGPGGIPTAPAEVAAGIPADLLRRRPDVRRAERQAAAQSAQIGIAEAEFYPHISITGTINYSAGTPRLTPVGVLATLVGPPQGLDGNIGPTFQWNILNFGRILNNVRLQDARFEELVAAYQNAVLTAAQDVENGLVTFLRAQERAKLQAASVDDLQKAVKIVLAQYKEGTVDLTRVTQVEQNLVLALDTLAQARGEIGLGLTQVYRALGGGWQIRLTGCETTAVPPQGGPPPPAGTRPAHDRELPPPRRVPPQDEKGPMGERRRTSGGGFASPRGEP
ncbi:MAG: efflux transporter, outer rane factor lipoprotein NodT family [Gemmataceae bacterium]|nr:efflux transporter, outer rane factor lipoprotein NodT family [Gemmataceae bacterium]